MTITLEERNFIAANYDASKRSYYTLREMFKEHFGYYVSSPSIRKIWHDNGFEPALHGGSRVRNSKPNENKKQFSNSPLEKDTQYFDNKTKVR